MNHKRHRAFMLMEMLVVVMLTLAGTGLITMGLASIIKSHKRIANLSNRYALVNDFFDTLRADVRAGTAVAWIDGDDAAPRQLQITGGTQSVLYRILVDSVERIDGGHIVKQWDMQHTDVTLQIESDRASEDLVRVSVLWHQKNKYDPDASRRFAATLRCVGELSHAPD